MPHSICTQKMFQLLIADSRSAPAGNGMQSTFLAAHEPPPLRPPSASASADTDTTATTSIAPSTKPALKPTPAEQVDADSEFMFNPHSADLPPGHQDTSGEPDFSFSILFLHPRWCCSTCVSYTDCPAQYSLASFMQILVQYILCTIYE